MHSFSGDIIHKQLLAPGGSQEPWDVLGSLAGSNAGIIHAQAKGWAPPVTNAACL